MAEFNGKTNINAISEQEDDEIDLLPLLQALKKKLGLIIVITVIAAALAFAVAKFIIPPTYRTSFTVYVNNKTDSGETTALSSSDITAAKSLASTYAEIISGRGVLTSAASKCGFNSMKYGELKELVEAKTSSSTEIITVYVKGSSPENALYFAEAIAQVASGQVSEIVDGSSMRVVDEPYLPEGVFSPNSLKVAAIAAVAACFAVCAVIVIKELMDDSVKDEHMLEDRSGIPVLGSIPDFDSASKKAYGYYGYGDRPAKTGNAVKTPKKQSTAKTTVKEKNNGR